MQQVPSEYAEQTQLFRWARLINTPLGRLSQFMFAIPNEGKRTLAMAAKLKAQGLRAGVPDVMVALPLHGKPGLFIEMKRTKGGKVSDKQQEWLDRLARAGYVTTVAHGAEEAQEIINDYLAGAA